MYQGYKITLVCDCHPRLVYHGICLGDGVTYETRTDDQLSGRKRVNARFKALLDEHSRYAFTVDHMGDFNSEYEAIMDEAARIERDDSTHPDKGFNVEKIDKKRLAKAEAAYVPGASDEDLFAANLVDLAQNNDQWGAYDTAENRAILFEIAKKNQKCSPHTAFAIALEAGALKPKVTL